MYPKGPEQVYYTLNRLVYSPEKKHSLLLVEFLQWVGLEGKQHPTGGK